MRCGYLDIERTVRRVMGLFSPERVESVPQLVDVDERARALATEAIAGVAL